MPSSDRPGEAAVRIYPPEEAIKHARPLPPRKRFVIKDVSDKEWAAFQEALDEA